MVLAEDLRQAVLQAALQGKLTEQLETDSNVEELLEVIKEHKYYLEETKKIYRKKPTVPFFEDDHFPFEIPQSWEWIQLSDVSIIQEGAGIRRFQYTTSGIQLLTVTNILESEIDLKKQTIFIAKEEYESKYVHLTVNKGDIVSACSGGSWGKTAIYNRNNTVMLNTSTLRLRFFDDLANNDYLYLLTKSDFFRNQIAKQQVGIQPNFGYSHYSRICIPFPPIEEQQRIVDKINDIMPKIDEYEKIEKELETLKKEFPTNMKDALLQAAMQGKLTEQLESDSSVDELLEAIRQEKEELITQKKIKKEKPLPDIEEEEIPFDIPENWRWVRLGNVGTLTRGNGIKRNEVTELGFPCVRYGELYTTYKTYFDVAVSHTSQEIFNKSQKVHTNDILMALTGENNFDIALALVYLGEEVIAMGGDLTRWSNHHMNPLYLVYVMNSSYAIHKKSEMAKGDIIVHISNDKLATILLPIPPIEEQNRIVERLEALLPLCEDLSE